MEKYDDKTLKRWHKEWDDAPVVTIALGTEGTSYRLANIVDKVSHPVIVGQEYKLIPVDSGDQYLSVATTQVEPV